MPDDYRLFDARQKRSFWQNHIDPAGVVNQTVQNGISQGRVGTITTLTPTSFSQNKTHEAANFR